MAIQQNFPEIKPSLNLDFANTKALDPRITFTRASEGRYYDGKTVAKAEENLLRYSQEFDNSYWTKDGSAVTPNSTTAPDGTSDADSIIETAVGGTHQARSGSASYTSGLTYVISVYAKIASGSRFLNIYPPFSVGGNSSGSYDLVNGTSTQNAGTGSGVASIQSVGNGWYRCVFTFIAQSTQISTFAVYFGLSDAIGQAEDSYTGDGTSGIYLWGAQLEQRSSVTAYTPTTTQAITNYVPVLQTAAAGVARFDHDPVTGESLGLLIEESRSNLILRSQEFDNASWTKTRSSVNANAFVAPDGTLTADTLVDTTDNDTHIALQNVTTTAVAITFSVFAKAAGRDFVYLSINDSGNVARTTFFNLSTGAVGTTGTGITASIVSVGNGWYRCIATVATAYAGANPCTIGVASADNTATYAGNGYSGVAVWGAQVE